MNVFLTFNKFVTIKNPIVKNRAVPTLVEAGPRKHDPHEIRLQLKM